MNDFNIKGFFLSAGLMLLMAALGYVIHPYFMHLYSYQLGDVQYAVTDLDTPLTLRLIFCAALAFVPLLFFTIQKMMKISEGREKIFILAAMIVSGIIFLQFRISSLKSQFYELNPRRAFPLQVFDMKDLHLELYLLTGFILGAALGGFALHRFRRSSRN